MVRHVLSSFDLSQTLLVGGGLLVPYSLLGPPVVKQLMQMVTRCLARVGGFSQCVSSNRRTGKPGVLQSMGCKELDTTESQN